MLAAPITSITPAGMPPGGKPIGSGPFRLVGTEPDSVRLVAHPSYFAGRPYLDGLTLRWYASADGEPRAYEGGGLDLSLRGAIAFAGHQPKHATEVAASAPSILAFVGFGKAHAQVTEDPDLRSALDLAIARDGFASIGTGEPNAPARDPVPHELGGTRLTPTAARPDLAAARAAVGRVAARHVGLAALRLELIVDRTRPDDRAIGEKVVAALYRIGLAVSLRELPGPEFARARGLGACDFYIGQLALGSLVPSSAWAAAFAAADQRFAEEQLIRAPFDERAMRAAFLARRPIIPLFHRGLRVHHRTELQRIEFDPLGRLRHVDVFADGRVER